MNNLQINLIREQHRLAIRALAERNGYLYKLDELLKLYDLECSYVGATDAFKAVRVEIVGSRLIEGTRDETAIWG